MGAEEREAGFRGPGHRGSRSAVGYGGGDGGAFGPLPSFGCRVPTGQTRRLPDGLQGKIHFMILTQFILGPQFLLSTNRKLTNTFPDPQGCRNDLTCKESRTPSQGCLGESQWEPGR